MRPASDVPPLIASKSYLLIKKCFNVYLFLREKERERDRERDREGQSISRGGEEREGDAESEAGSRLRAVSAEPDAGLELTSHEIMT